MRDEIVEEVRRAREAYAERFNFDLGAICDDLMRRQRESGREYVNFLPRQIVDTGDIADVEPVRVSDPGPTAPLEG